jgi:hypothetical protein
MLEKLKNKRTPPATNMLFQSAPLNNPDVNESNCVRNVSLFSQIRGIGGRTKFLTFMLKVASKLNMRGIEFAGSSSYNKLE